MGKLSEGQKEAMTSADAEVQSLSIRFETPVEMEHGNPLVPENLAFRFVTDPFIADVSNMIFTIENPELEQTGGNQLTLTMERVTIPANTATVNADVYVYIKEVVMAGPADDSTPPQVNDALLGVIPADPSSPVAPPAAPPAATPSIPAEPLYVLMSKRRLGDTRSGQNWGDRHVLAYLNNGDWTNTNLTGISDLDDFFNDLRDNPVQGGKTYAAPRNTWLDTVGLSITDNDSDYDDVDSDCEDDETCFNVRWEAGGKNPYLRVRDVRLRSDNDNGQLWALQQL